MGGHSDINESPTNTSIKAKYGGVDPQASGEVNLSSQEEEVVAKANVVRQRSQEL